MKQIIVFLLLVIIGIMGYNQYDKYKRYHGPDSAYKPNDSIDKNYYDQSIVKNYYKSVEQLNGFAATQWSSHEIDVKKPKKDNTKTQYAVSQYRDLLADVNYYETLLLQSAKYKGEGLSNKDIKLLIEKATTEEKISKALQKELTKKHLINFVRENPLDLDDVNLYVYEAQKLLIANGHNIRLDGIYRQETKEAVRAFEEKNDLYADGILDEITVEFLAK